MLVYRSDRIQMARVVFPTALGLLASLFFYIIRLQQEGFSLLFSVIAVLVAGLAVMTGHILNNAVIATISETTFSFRQGFGIFGSKPKSIPLQHIHTLAILLIPREEQWNLEPRQIGIIYRWPARKMVHATVDFPVAAIPNGKEFLLELVRRTGAKIKLYTTDLDAPIILTLEEFAKRLGLPEPKDEPPQE